MQQSNEDRYQCRKCIERAEQRINRHVAEAIVAYRREESELLVYKMPAKDITLTQDKTFTNGLCLIRIRAGNNYILLEQIAQVHDQDTW